MIADPFDTPPSASPKPREDDPGAFEALADIFLGTMGGVAAHDAAMGVTPRSHAAVPPAEPDLHRVEPRSGPTGRAERPRLTLVGDLHHTREPAQEAAESGSDGEGGRDLSRRVASRAGPGSGSEPPRAPLPPPLVEAVILGHLPVLASAWASQYVRHVADRLQAPAAMVRVGAGRVRIEIVPPAGTKAEVRPAASLDAALRTLSAVRRVVVMGDASSEMRAARSPGVERVTLLSSGDEAGIVAAYGIVKQLVQSLPAPEGWGGEAGGEDPSVSASRIHVAVLGAPPARADDVLDRLDKACRTFLSLPLKRDACIARIGSGALGAEIFEGALDAPVEDLIAMLAIGPVPEVPTPARQADAHAHADVDAHADADAEIGADAREFRAEPAGPASPARPVARPGPSAGPSAGSGAAAGAAPRVAPAPRLEASAAPAACASDCPSEDGEHHPEGALASLVDGLRLIEARCPTAPEIEIAIAECGTLHVLARAEAYGEPGRALIRLETAAGWARLNRRVLALTLPPGHRAASAAGLAGAGVVPHLFTDQPSHWRTLLDGDIRLHVMLPVVAAVGGWACAAMN